jgi:peptide chain release factor 2
LNQQLLYLRGLFEIDVARETLKSLEEVVASNDLWNDRKRATELLKEKRQLEDQIKSYDSLKNTLADNIGLAELAELENDEVMLDIVENDLKNLSYLAAKLEIECLFSGEADMNNCFLEINAGAGGTESHDWASMMMRMYLRFAERMKFKTEILSLISGEDAGIKSCTIKILGHNAYGWFKTESGVHRLVRISPYNAAGKRMTSFASAWVYPEIEDDIDIEIEEKDLRIDTYRSSGAGGQHVNTTDSAVRITHLPTNIAVQCQSDRSQHKNRAEAMKMLKARLYEIELKKREEAIESENATKTENGWGHQIRSYVLQPYQMVKDLRTEHETSDTQGVLDGDLENFISASLAMRVGKK